MLVLESSPQPCSLVSAPFPPAAGTKATGTSVTTSNAVVEQVPRGANRAPLMGSLKASPGHRWDRRGAWEKPPHTSRYPQWSLHSSTFWHLDSDHPQHPTISSFSPGFDPKEESSETYCLDDSSLYSLPSSHMAAGTAPEQLLTRGSQSYPSSPMMPQLQEPGPCPCSPWRLHSWPLSPLVVATLQLPPPSGPRHLQNLLLLSCSSDVSALQRVLITSAPHQAP